MSSTGSSSSSDSASASGSDDSSSSDDERETPRPLAHTSPNRQPVANGGADRPQGNNQLMNTLRKGFLSSGYWYIKPYILAALIEVLSPLQETTFSSASRGATVMMNDRPALSPPTSSWLSLLCCDLSCISQFDSFYFYISVKLNRLELLTVYFFRCIFFV